jgi:hypothetical protein
MYVSIASSIDKVAYVFVDFPADEVDYCEQPSFGCDGEYSAQILSIDNPTPGPLRVSVFLDNSNENCVISGFDENNEEYLVQAHFAFEVFLDISKGEATSATTAAAFTTTPSTSTSMTNSSSNNVDGHKAIARKDICEFGRFHPKTFHPIFNIVSCNSEKLLSLR